MLDLSIVASLYRSAEHLSEFCERARASAVGLGCAFEIVLVDDGSPDDSVARALALRARIPELRIVELGRHYGHYSAVLAGLAAASGGLVFLIDCDLEEPPELLATFWQELHENPDLDAVYGVQRHRKGGLFERWSGALFYRLLRLSVNPPVAADTTMARLMRRRFVAALLRHTEAPVSLDVLTAVVGLRQRGLPVEKGSRRASTYRLSRKLDVAVRALVTYGALPAWTAMCGGCAALATCTALALAFGLRAGRAGLATHAALLSVWAFGGALLIVAGAIALAIDQLLVEVRRRPTVVREVDEGGTPGSLAPREPRP